MRCTHFKALLFVIGFSVFTLLYKFVSYSGGNDDGSGFRYASKDDLQAAVVPDDSRPSFGIDDRIVVFYNSFFGLSIVNDILREVTYTRDTFRGRVEGVSSVGVAFTRILPMHFPALENYRTEVYEVTIGATDLRQRLYISDDRQLAELDTAIVVFHSRDYNFVTLPEKRGRRNIWVWMSFESPAHTDWPRPDDAGSFVDAQTIVFNWTWTYRQRSTIRGTYGHVDPLEGGMKPPPPKVTLVKGNSSSERHFVVTLMSSCDETQSQRNKFLTRFKTIAPVRSYGKCGLQCPGEVDGDAPSDATKPLDKLPRSVDCLTSLRTEGHVFFLVLENSRCDEYVTEKVFMAWRVGMIPIVVAADGSKKTLIRLVSTKVTEAAIFAEDFESVEALAEYVVSVNANDQLLKKYQDAVADLCGSKIRTFDRCHPHGATMLMLPGIKQIVDLLQKEEYYLDNENRTMGELQAWWNSACQSMST